MTRVGGSVTSEGGSVTRVGGSVTSEGGCVTRIDGSETRVGGSVTSEGGCVTRIGGSVNGMIRRSDQEGRAGNSLYSYRKEGRAGHGREFTHETLNQESMLRLLLLLLLRRRRIPAAPLAPPHTPASPLMTRAPLAPPHTPASPW